MTVSRSYEQKGKDLLSRLSRTIKQGAETLVQETKELTRVGKLKMDLLSLENERGRRFEEIGRLAHTLYKEKADLGPLGEHFDAVDEIEGRIDAKNKEIENIRISTDQAPDGSPDARVEEVPGEKAAEGLAPENSGDETVEIEDESTLNKGSRRGGWCAQCGQEVEAGDNFCSQCGNPLIG